VQRGYVQYYQVLADRVGGFKPALMLGHALYWTRNWLQEHPERGGWFWKTANDWADATGLSSREQESARAELRNIGVWQENLTGSPARLYFRIDLAALAATLGIAGLGTDDPPHWESVAKVLGAPVMYFKALADLAGGVSAGLVLSHLIGLQRSAALHRHLDLQGFFPAPVEDARIALGLGTKVQRNARDALKRAGFVQEAWSQEQRPKLLARLNLQAILACLSGQVMPQRRGRKAKATSHAIEAAPLQHSLLPNRAQIVGQDGNVTRVVRLLDTGSNAPGLPVRRLLAQQASSDSALHDDGGNRHSRVALLSKQQALSDAKGCPFVETRVALLSKLYIQNNITNTTTARARDGSLDEFAGLSSCRTLDLPFEQDKLAQESTAQAIPAPQSAQAAGAPRIVAELILPDKLDASLHDGALRLVAVAEPDLQQRLLDELAGNLGSPRKTIHNPLAWLKGLVDRSLEGNVVFTLAASVAAARQSRQAAQARLATAMNTGPVIQASSEASQVPKPNEAASAFRVRYQQQRRDILGRQVGLSTDPMEQSGPLQPANSVKEFETVSLRNMAEEAGSSGVANTNIAFDAHRVANPNNAYTGCAVADSNSEDA